MTGAEWESIRAKAERAPRRKVWPADRWTVDPWGDCRARWAWWGRAVLWPIAWVYRHGRAAAFRGSARWRRRRALARLRLAERAGRQAATARTRGDPSARCHLARAAALWRQARALADGHWC